MDLEAAKSIMDTLACIEYFLVKVCSAPSEGAFTDLHTTIRIESIEVTPFIYLVNVDDILSGHTNNKLVEAALDRLMAVLVSKKLETLKSDLLDADERCQMIAIIKHVLQPLTGHSVVANRREYSWSKEILTGYLGIGSELTWHGASAAQCDLDMLSLDQVEEDELSDTESSGTKTLFEAKPGRLGPKHLNQTCSHVWFCTRE